MRIWDILGARVIRIRWRFDDAPYEIERSLINLWSMVRGQRLGAQIAMLPLLGISVVGPVSALLGTGGDQIAGACALTMMGYFVLAAAARVRRENRIGGCEQGNV